MSQDEMLQRMVDEQGLAATVNQVVQQEVRRLVLPHHPLPMVIALQFWDGDIAEAMSLARLLADAEPEPRDDVLFLLARRGAGPVASTLVAETALYVGHKFPVQVGNFRFPMFDGRYGEGHPDGCYALWAGVVASLAYDFTVGKNAFAENFFTFEPDGCPLRLDWIDFLKQAHAQNLAEGKRVTGHLVQKAIPHVNGSLVMHWSCWHDHPSLGVCPSGQAWDIFHRQVLMSECGKVTPLFNGYGFRDLSRSVFNNLGREYGWLANVKDVYARVHFKELVDAAKG